MVYPDPAAHSRGNPKRPQGRWLNMQPLTFLIINSETNNVYKKTPFVLRPLSLTG